MKKAIGTSQRQIKSQERVKDFGEVFTPDWLVSDMCDLCEPDISDPGKTVLEPACGNGNFLVEVLRRKLAKCNGPKEVLAALGNIYGIDIQEDNVLEARDRMFDILPDAARPMGEIILARNIVAGDFLKPETVWFLDCLDKPKQGSLV